MKKCALEGCNKKARKKFCCNKHKDRFHNLHNPRGYFSPRNDDYKSFEDDHPLSMEAIGQD